MTTDAGAVADEQGCKVGSSDGELNSLLFFVLFVFLPRELYSLGCPLKGEGVTISSRVVETLEYLFANTVYI